MSELATKDYIVTVQCHIVTEYCSGYFCEKSFHERSGGFAEYPSEGQYRRLMLTCGGCCGRALQRKLLNLVKKLRKHEGVAKDRIIIQLSSCITRSNFHGPACPHLDYLKTLITRAGLDFREDTHISKRAEQRRAEGLYGCGE